MSQFQKMHWPELSSLMMFVCVCARLFSIFRSTRQAGGDPRGVFSDRPAQQDTPQHAGTPHLPSGQVSVVSISLRQDSLTMRLWNKIWIMRLPLSNMFVSPAFLSRNVLDVKMSIWINLEIKQIFLWYVTGLPYRRRQTGCLPTPSLSCLLPASSAAPTPSTRCRASKTSAKPLRMSNTEPKRPSVVPQIHKLMLNCMNLLWMSKFENFISFVISFFFFFL